VYAYPPTAPLATRLLKMRTVFAAMDGAVSAVTGQRVSEACLLPQILRLLST
jgi:hypothetical protein